MDYHHHARLTVHGRELLGRAVVEGRLGLCEAAAEYKLSRQTAAKWVKRYRELGVEGLPDRSSRPVRLRRATSPELVSRVEALRRERWTGQRIAQQTGLSRATVSRILRRAKLSRRRDLDPKLPVQRYEHVAIDDHSRIAFSAIYPDETQASVLAFLAAALAYYARLGIQFKAILTDNGPAYRSHAMAAACKRLGLKHRFTRPYTPRTNGKAERFIQTALCEWAYARTYQNSNERNQQLRPWLHQYNWHRPHSSLGLSPPISRSAIHDNNLLTLHT